MAPATPWLYARDSGQGFGPKTQVAFRSSSLRNRAQVGMPLDCAPVRLERSARRRVHIGASSAVQKRTITMLYNLLGAHQSDIVNWKYLSCAVAAAVFGVAVIGERLVSIPGTSVVESKHDDDTGRALVEAAAVQPTSVAVATAIESHGQQEADIHQEADVKIDQAMAGFDQAIERNPRDATAFRNRAKAWEARGETQRALADYDAAIRIAPDDPAAFRGRGEMWRRLGMLDRALLDLDRAIRFTFADADIYCHRGLVWDQEGDHDRAVADFNQAIKLDPRRACAYMGRGLALLGKGEPARARADLNEAIRLDPSLRDVVGRTKMSLEEDADGKQ
jgi:tetratricopeptide (TPR) repeat protein